jgi:hypothetical protein
MTEEKIRKIRKMLRRGIPEGEIKEVLKEEGYSKEDIDKVFQPHQYDMRSWYLFFGIAISLAGFYLFLKNGNILILILGLFLFVAYFAEIKRLGSLKK